MLIVTLTEKAFSTKKLKFFFLPPLQIEILVL